MARSVRLLLMLVIVATGLWVAPAHARAPERTITQFKHERWSIEEGAPGYIIAIVQSPDGYLLLGTSSGLYQFDGISFTRVPWLGKRLPGSNQVNALMVRRSGEIWVGYISGDIAQYVDGKLTNLQSHVVADSVYQMVEDRAGAVWVSFAGKSRGLARYADRHWQVIGSDWGLPDGQLSILVARDGTLWVTTRTTKMFLPPGSRRFRATGQTSDYTGWLAEDSQGQVWTADDAGGVRVLHKLNDPSEAPFASYRMSKGSLWWRMTFAPDGSLWAVNRSEGLFRIPHPGVTSDVQRFNTTNGLTSDLTDAVFPDREGGVWVGTTTGIDHFYPSDVVAEEQIPPWSRLLYGMVRDAGGRIWIIDSTTLYRIDPGGSPRPVRTGLGNPQAICQAGDGAIWLVDSTGIFRSTGGDFIPVRTPTLRVPLVTGLSSKTHLSIFGCAADATGNLWFSAIGDGLFRYDGRQWYSYPLKPGAISGWAGPIGADGRGRINVYFHNRSLARVEGDHQTEVWKSPDIGDINTLTKNARGLLIGGWFGIAEEHDGQIISLSAGAYPWLSDVTGIAQGTQDTWIIGTQGVVRIRTRDLEWAFAHPGQPIPHRIYDVRDGLRGAAMIGTSNDIAVGGDGRVWVLTAEGVSFIDPANPVRNAVAPPVHIRQLRAADGSHPTADGLVLPGGTRDLQIDYTAPSFTIPDRVRFRYRLEGVDHDWVDPGSRRQAFYTNLGPGHYRFRVIAANDDGVWNRTGATLNFVIRPTFRESPFFSLLCLIAIAGLAWLAYAWRMRLVTERMRERLEAGAAERERIARELHDTLLQGFHALLVRFQLVVNEFPASAPARRKMDEALHAADRVMVEGRDRVFMLRSTLGQTSLPEAFEAIAEQLLADSGTRLQVNVTGTPRPVRLNVQDEFYRIGTEAVVNAIRHADASWIAVSIFFSQNSLRLCVEDDGGGISAGALGEENGSRHFGIRGMKERAGSLGATFSLSGEAGKGTSVVVEIAARSAYQPPRRARIADTLGRSMRWLKSRT